MRTLSQILAIALKAHNLDDLWPADTAPKDHPHAVRGRFLNGTVEGLTPEEGEILQSWCQEIKPDWQASDEAGQNTYYVYPDGSLYYSSTSEDEIWDSAGELADRIASEPCPLPLDKMNVKLLQLCGRPVYQVCDDRGGALDSWPTKKAAVESAREAKRSNPDRKLVVMKNRVKILKR